MGLQTVEFEVCGRPAPQGSKSYKGHHSGKPILAESSQHLTQWRGAVAGAALLAASQEPDAPFDCPVELSVEFRFAMPKVRRHLGHERIPKLSAPDLDKLVRAVGDALQDGQLLASDARIVRLNNVEKWEVTGWTGAIIRVTRWVDIPTDNQKHAQQRNQQGRPKGS